MAHPIRDALKRNAMKQVDLAKEMEVSPEFISRLVNDRTAPGPDARQDLVEALDGLTLDQLHEHYDKPEEVENAESA